MHHHHFLENCHSNTSLNFIIFQILNHKPRKVSPSKFTFAFFSLFNECIKELDFKDDEILLFIVKPKA